MFLPGFFAHDGVSKRNVLGGGVIYIWALFMWFCCFSLFLQKIGKMTKNLLFLQKIGHVTIFGVCSVDHFFAGAAKKIGHITNFLQERQKNCHITNFWQEQQKKKKKNGHVINFLQEQRKFSHMTNFLQTRLKSKNHMKRAMVQGFKGVVFSKGAKGVTIERPLEWTFGGLLDHRGLIRLNILRAKKLLDHCGRPFSRGDQIRVIEPPRLIFCHFYNLVFLVQQGPFLEKEGFMPISNRWRSVLLTVF